MNGVDSNGRYLTGDKRNDLQNRRKHYILKERSMYFSLGKKGQTQMKRAIKKAGRKTEAYCLGTSSPVLDELIRQGKIVEKENGIYEVFSREAVNGSGEIARKGDYIKLDSAGKPYPNDGDFFRKNHRHIKDCIYEQIPEPVNIWEYGDDMCPEIRFLVKNKGLVMDEKNPEKFFCAPLWGSILSADKNAVIVFYSITCNERGDIADADFNFVAGDEFQKTYIRLDA